MTLKFISRFIFGGVLCCLPLFTQAQQTQPVDTVVALPKAGEAEAVDTENSFSFIPEEIRLGVDLSRLMGNLVNPEGTYYEFNGDLRFGRYYLSGDWGMGRQERMSDILEYRTEGTFFRVGPDYNIIPDDEDRNTMFVGLRYGRSSYSERLLTTYTRQGWGDVPLDLDREAKAHWFELVAGMKARVYNNFYLGYTLRYKFGLETEDLNNFTSYEVPGFGRVGDGNTFSFNYHIVYRIPFTR